MKPVARLILSPTEKMEIQAEFDQLILNWADAVASHLPEETDTARHIARAWIDRFAVREAAMKARTKAPKNGNGNAEKREDR